MKLIDLIKEIGDSSLPPYEVDRRESRHDDNLIEYRFTTDSGTEYILDVEKDMDWNDEGNDLDQYTYTVSFNAREKGARTFDTKVVNKGEQYRVMSTVVKCIKQEIEYDRKENKAVQRIKMFPAGQNGEGRKRLNLYLQYIKKELPNATVEKDRHSMQSDDYKDYVIKMNKEGS